LNGTAESVQPTKQLSSKALKQAEMARIEAAVAGTQEPSNVLFGEFDKQGTVSHSNELTNQCDVMLVASPKELIDDYTTIVEAAGLTPRTIEFKAMSLYRLVSSMGIVSDNQTVLIADINEISSDLSIFHGTQLKITRNVPLAFGYSPSKEIQAPSGGHSLFSEFSEPVNQEEEFFKNACGDLAHELERLMNFYRYTLGNRDHEFATIVISGDIDRISEIVDYCRERLSLNVQVLFSLLIDTDFDDVHNLIPRIAVPLGLGLRGSER
jgi:type IV pilus assembly protein PilM